MQNGPNNPNFPDGFSNPHPHGVELPNEEVSDEVKDDFIDEEETEISNTVKKEGDISKDAVKFNLDKVDELEESKKNNKN